MLEYTLPNTCLLYFFSNSLARRDSLENGLKAEAVADKMTTMSTQVSKTVNTKNKILVKVLNLYLSFNI